jgi:hypothetical protein
MRGKRDRDDASHVTAQCKQAAANSCLRLERPDFPFAARRAAGARRLLSRAAWLSCRRRPLRQRQSGRLAGFHQRGGSRVQPDP